MGKPNRTQMDCGTISPKMTAIRQHPVFDGKLDQGQGLTDEDGTADDGSNASAQGAVEHDGQRLVDDDIRQEERDEHPVLPLLEQIQDPPGILMLRLREIVRDHLKVDAVLAHEPNMVVSMRWKSGVSELVVDVRDGQAGECSS